MALSGSTDFNMTALDLLKAAYKCARVLSIGGTLTADEVTDGLESMNLILRSWAPHGLKLWQMRDKAITMVADTASLTLGPSGGIVMDRPVDITSAYLRDSNGVDTQLTKMSRDDYRSLSTKASSGMPYGFYYDAQRINGVIYLHNVPRAAEVAEYTLHINYRKPIDDVDASTDDVEIPPEWYRALKWNLAVEIAIENDSPPRTMQRIERMAEQTLQEAKQTDIEFDTSIMFGAED